jgi:probable F420-dependent oxidoreductase
MVATQSRPTVAIQLALQDGGSFDRLRSRWEEIEALGADTIYVSDHFVSVNGIGDGSTFEAMSTLAAIAEATDRVQIGSLVLGNSFRNPNLVADMARTIDHISGGRMVLGLGAGYAPEDYERYGYEFGTTGSRLRDLELGLETIRARFTQLKPPPLRKIPILVAGGGEKVMLRLVAQHADIWGITGRDLEAAARKVAVLEDWCERVGRDAREIARSAYVAHPRDDTIRDPSPYLEIGCTELVVGAWGPDWPLDTLRELVVWREERFS